jgi:hypothetical protein
MFMTAFATAKVERKTMVFVIIVVVDDNAMLKEATFFFFFFRLFIMNFVTFVFYYRVKE